MNTELVWQSNSNLDNQKMYLLCSINNCDDYEYYSEHDNETIENLIRLKCINIPSIMNVLEKRYYNNNIYTYNGDIIVSINPFRPIDIYSNNTIL